MSRIRSRRALAALAFAAAQLTLAYRFALVYRSRAGYPRRWPPAFDPSDIGCEFEPIAIPSASGPLPGWFVPARGGRPGPGVVLVHGWESNRARLLPNVRFLVAAGFHCLLFDVRGHGQNGPELLPISGAEFGEDAAAAARLMRGRPEIEGVALLGHSMGGVGAALAAATEPWIAGLVLISTPADPRLMTRQTFRIARLPIPGPVAQPLAWLTSRVYIRPRGHSIGAVSARRAVGRYPGPILVIHGSEDAIIPVSDLGLLAKAAAGRRRGVAGAHGRRPSDPRAPLETLVIPGGAHSWLYEYPAYRRAVGRFLATVLGGPLAPDAAGEIAAATQVERPIEPETPFSAIPQGALEILSMPPAGSGPDLTERGLAATE